MTCFSLSEANNALCIMTCFSLSEANYELCIMHYYRVSSAKVAQRFRLAKI